MHPEKNIVLGLCTANRCRSQMFEAIMKHFASGQFEVISAGTKATFVHPLAIKGLAEIGISTQGQISKKIVALDPVQDKLILADQNGQQIEYPLSMIKQVVTLCGGAKESCPLFPGKVHREHWPIDDPDQYSGNESEVLPYFRASRDDILNRVKIFINSNKGRWTRMTKQTLWQKVLAKIDQYLQKKSIEQSNNCCSGSKKGDSSCCK